MKWLRMGIQFWGRVYNTSSYTMGRNSISWNMMDGDFILLKQFNVTTWGEGQGSGTSALSTPYFNFVDIFGRIDDNNNNNVQGYDTSLVWKITCRQENHNLNNQPYLEISLCKDEYVHGEFGSRHNLRSVAIDDVNKRVKYYEALKAENVILNYFTQEDSPVWRLPEAFTQTPIGLIRALPMHKAGVCTDLAPQYYNANPATSSNVNLWYNIPKEGPVGTTSPYSADNTTKNEITRLQKYEQLLSHVGSLEESQSLYLLNVPNVGTHKISSENQTAIWAGPINYWGDTDAGVLSTQISGSYKTIMNIISGGSYYLGGDYDPEMGFDSRNRAHTVGWWVPNMKFNNILYTPDQQFTKSGLTHSAWLYYGPIMPYKMHLKSMSPRAKSRGAACIWQISDDLFGTLQSGTTRPTAMQNTDCLGTLADAGMIPFSCYDPDDLTYLINRLNNRFGSTKSAFALWNNTIPGYIGTTIAKINATNDTTAHGIFWNGSGDYDTPVDPTTAYPIVGSMGIRVATFSDSLWHDGYCAPQGSTSIDCYIVPSSFSPFPSLDIYGQNTSYGETNQYEPFNFMVHTDLDCESSWDKSIIIKRTSGRTFVSNP